MSHHDFHMRLSCQYETDKNNVINLAVDNYANGEWRALELSPESPGFLIFVYAIFTCQHLYFRSNAAERGLQLASANGTVEVSAGEDWVIKKLRVRFEAQLAVGSPSVEDVDYITGRMRQCPATINLREIADAETTISFD